MRAFICKYFFLSIIFSVYTTVYNNVSITQDE